MPKMEDPCNYTTTMDLKMMRVALEQLEAERGITKEEVGEAIEMALAAAYKKDYGRRGQIIRANFDFETGITEFSQIKIVVDESMLKPETEEGDDYEEVTIDENGVKKIRFNSEHHIMLEEAQKIKKDVKPEDEIIFPLESKMDYGRIAAQTAKQVITQRIREAERRSVYAEFKSKENTIVNGIVQRVEVNNVFINLEKTTAILPREEQMAGERYRVGERTRALLYLIEDTPRGINLYLSRSHPKFLAKLFEIEVPEITNGVVEIKSIVREAGSRSKIAVLSKESGVDPVGACVGQKGVRVGTIISELGGEKIDLIEWSDNIEKFIGNSLSPAKVVDVEITDADSHEAKVIVDEDQLSLAIGKGGQNVRLAARLTGWRIDISSRDGKSLAKASDEGMVIEEEKIES